MGQGYVAWLVLLVGAGTPVAMGELSTRGFLAVGALEKKVSRVRLDIFEAARMATARLTATRVFQTLPQYLVL